MSKLVRLVVSLVGAVSLLGGVWTVSASAASPPGSVSCRLVNGIPVALSQGALASYQISGELCATPAELSSGETVQLAIHGATYNHKYWDFGTVDDVSYSYARDLAAAGYPVFAIDEVGTAETSPPVPSADITIDAVAFVAHEVVQDLLSGQIAGARFGKVIEVAHSLGSITAMQEAGTYHDVAGVIITGDTHELTTAGVTQLTNDIYPSTDDPAFKNSGLDSGYLTTLPGTRGNLFYNAADSDPNVITQDEATKDVSSGAFLPMLTQLLQSSISQQINVPVLLIMGGDDGLFCGPDIFGTTFSCSSGQEVASEEASFYSSAAQLRACVIPDSGHDINLSLNHVLEEADALAWSREYVGQQGVPAVPARVLPPDCSRA